MENISENVEEIKAVQASIEKREGHSLTFIQKVSLLEDLDGFLGACVCELRGVYYKVIYVKRDIRIVKMTYLERVV
ncbi:hypothetical protein HCA00_02410 [Listeria booriae]|uniref:hypothetical protein n=1 Tax=Listeria booriae TaxID=1552123 RepID=UPI0016259E5C|nr:hypothetical protein [Listeria booriae]MBC1522660.1 hypothetical protein [Listeria booriae]MBC2256966.1 hypothetical protein [Listeria booriae]MBC6127638.1 hypothetical protein [Listeria booriae]